MNKKITILYEKYGAMVYRRCYTLLGNEASAADATQDVFVSLVSKYDQLTFTTPSSLLYRIATNVCLNKIRKKKRELDVFDAEGDSDLLERIANLDDVENHHFFLQLLGHLFHQEPVSSKTIAVMHLLDGFTLQEVADEMKMSVSGVRKRLRKLQSKLKELEGFEHV